MSCLTHQIDALRWYGGEIDKVECMTKIVPSRMEGETIGVVTAKMKSGALALLSINWHTQSHSWGGDVKNGLWYEFNHVTGTKGEAHRGAAANLGGAGGELGVGRRQRGVTTRWP